MGISRETEVSKQSGTSRKAYRSLRVAIILNLFMGVQYCWSVISPRCAELFGWSPSQATLPYTVLTVTTALGGIIVARMGEKYGPGKVIFLGGVLVGLGLCICSVSQSLGGMIFGYGLVTAFGLASISMNTSSTAMKWFSGGRKGLAAGASTMCIGLSSLYMAPLIEGILGKFGLEHGLRILGVCSGILVCIFSFLLPTPTQSVSHTDAEEMKTKDHSRYHDTVTPSKIVKTREFWFLLVLYAMNWMPGQMIFSSVSTICEVQAGWEKGYIAVMAVSLGNGLGRFFSSTISDRIGGRRTMTILISVQIVNLLIFMFYRAPAVIVLGVLVLGFCVGAGVPLLMVLISNIYGLKYVGSMFAILQLGYSLSGVLAPQIASRILEASGTYTVSYYINVVFLLIGLYCVYGLRAKGAVNRTATDK